MDNKSYDNIPNSDLLTSPELSALFKHGPFQAVVGLGMGWELMNDENAWELRVQGRFNALSCLLLYTLKMANSVILSGGHTTGINNNAEAEEMLSICTDILGDQFRPQDFFIETDSLDTSGNIIGLQTLIDQDGEPKLDDLLLLTTKAQLTGRVAQYLAAYDVNEVTLKLASDELIPQIMRFLEVHYAEVRDAIGLENWEIVQTILNDLCVELVNLAQKQEFMFGPVYQSVLSLLAKLDPQGDFLRRLAQKRARFNQIPTTTEPYPSRLSIEKP